MTDLVHPYAPLYPHAGGVLHGKAVSVNGSSSTTSSIGKFAVLDPIAETVRAFQMTPPSGYTFNHSLWGGAADGRLWCVFQGGTSGATAVMAVSIDTDGSHSFYPAPFTAYVTATLVTPDHVWALPAWDGITAYAPQVFDIGTASWLTTSMSALVGNCQPVYAGGSVYHWADDTLYRYSDSSFSRSTVATDVADYPAQSAQAAIVGDLVYWRTRADDTLLIVLDTTDDSLSTLDVGVAFGLPLIYQPSESSFYSLDGTGGTLSVYNVDTHVSFTASTGFSHSPRYVGVMGHLAAGKVCFPVGHDI